MKGMRGVVSKVPRGWRNIQVVHLKTPDSVALPLYHSLPPEAKILAPLSEGPAEKRVKLGSVDTDAEEGEEGEEGEGEQLQAVSQEEDGERKSLVRVRPAAAVVSTPPPSSEQKKKV